MVSRDTNPTLRTGFAVSIKNFRRAVDRNRIKRLMKENYRVRKSGLLEKIGSLQVSLSVFIIYISKEKPSSMEMGTKMDQVITRLLKNIHENDITNR